MVFFTLKILDLNPSVPEEQMYDLLCEKFSAYPDVQIHIVQQDNDRVAFLDFKSSANARAALRENSLLALFGYACRVIPIYKNPREVIPGGNDYDEDHQDEPDLKASPERPRGSFWQRSRKIVGGRGRGRPYLLTRGRGRKYTGKPYLLTKPRESEERKPHVPPRGRGGKKLDPVEPDTAEAVEEEEPNSTLYVGSMDPSVKVVDLQRLFTNFGFVLDVEIKFTKSNVAFAFVHFLNMDMAHLAKQEMDGKPIGHSVPKLGYGRCVESRILWVGGLGKWTTEDMLNLEFNQFGDIEKIEWPANRDYAYVVFRNIIDAIDAKQAMHGCHHGDPPHRLRVSYATTKQFESPINYKAEFPKFPNVPRPPNTKRKRYKGNIPQKRRSRDQESQDSRRRRRRSAERSRSHSRSRRGGHPPVKSRRKERTPSPYGSSISQASSENDMSAISDASSGSVGSSERKRQRKRHRKSSVSRSPADKLLRNPSPPKSTMKDERTVVLRSEQLPITAVSGATSDVFKSAMSQIPTAAVPAYAPPVDPMAYYPPAIASSLPPTMYPPPVHIPPPDYYVPPNPMMPPFQQHLPPLVSYPLMAVDSAQPVPTVTQSTVPPVQPSTYVSSSTHPDAASTKELQKPASVSVATKFPKVWSGALVLRNAAFVVDFHLLSGSVLLVNSLLGTNVEPGSDADCPVLKIAQRLRLDQPQKLEELDRRLKTAGRTGCSVLLATSTLAQVDDDANVVQQYPLSSLVTYLLQKQVAAVVSLPPGVSDAAKASGILHAFPPCQFAKNFLNREAPGLPSNCPTEEELLVVLCES